MKAIYWLAACKVLTHLSSFNQLVWIFTGSRVPTQFSVAQQFHIFLNLSMQKCIPEISAHFPDNPCLHLTCVNWQHFLHNELRELVVETPTLSYQPQGNCVLTLTTHSLSTCVHHPLILNHSSFVRKCLIWSLVPSSVPYPSFLCIAQGIKFKGEFGSLFGPIDNAST